MLVVPLIICTLKSQTIIKIKHPKRSANGLLRDHRLEETEIVTCTHTQQGVGTQAQ